MSHSGQFWHHPKFRDVVMEVITSFYIEEKKAYSLKVRWWHKRGWMLSNPYRITMSEAKVAEFTKKGWLK